MGAYCYTLRPSEVFANQRKASKAGKAVAVRLKDIDAYASSEEKVGSNSELAMFMELTKV